LSIKKNDRNGLKSKPPRKCTDISFMATKNPNVWIDLTTYGIFEAHFSLSIVASDNLGWTGYSFADDELDADNLEDDESSTADEENEGEEEGNEDYGEDPIVPADSDHPMMDAREYFLKTLDSRTCRSLYEWTCIIHTLGGSIRNYASVFLASSTEKLPNY
jgi:hypothetical protein